MPSFRQRDELVERSKQASNIISLLAIESYGGSVWSGSVASPVPEGAALEALCFYNTLFLFVVNKLRRSSDRMINQTHILLVYSVWQLLVTLEL